MSRRKQREATLNVQGWVEVRTAVQALRAITAQSPGNAPRTWSELVERALEMVAMGAEAPQTVGEAMEELRLMGFSTEQLNRRGSGIRDAISNEEQSTSQTAQTIAMAKRTAEIARMLEEEE